MNILITGAHGRMGKTLSPMLGGHVLYTPPRADLNLRNSEAISSYLHHKNIDAVLHLAAYTDVAKAEQDRENCYADNVVSVRNLARACQHIPYFVHISTDYVFDGERGNYSEDEPVSPSNYYSLTKALGEEAARTHPQHLIIRTSFKTAPWAYPKAFTDQYTSADDVDVIAKELQILMDNLEFVAKQARVLHIGTERKSIYDLAIQRTPSILPMSRVEAKVHIPPDVSLNVALWKRIKNEVFE